MHVLKASSLFPYSRAVLQSLASCCGPYAVVSFRFILRLYKPAFDVLLLQLDLATNSTSLQG